MFKFIIKRSNNRRLKTLANNLFKNKIIIDKSHKLSNIKNNIKNNNDFNKQQPNKDKMNEKKSHNIIIYIMDNCSLMNIVILIRHGARAPIKSNSILHKEIYKNWKKHDGHLTKIGEKQSELLGNTIAKKYHKYGYVPKIIYADSSDTQRTKKSLKLFIKGWNKIYKNSYLGKYYYIKYKGKYPFLKLRYKFSNMNKNKEINIIKHHFERKDIDKLLKNIKIQLKNKCNLEIDITKDNEPYIFTKIYNSRVLNECSNKHQPIINVNDRHNILKYFTRLTFNKKYTNKISLKLIGSTPKIIFNNLFKKKNKTATILFSHDNTLAAYLTYLDIIDWPVPQFNGYISFELWKHNVTKEEYVLLSYNPNPFNGTEIKFNNNSKYIALPNIDKNGYYHDITSLSKIPMKKNIFINKYNRYKYIK